MRGRKPKPAALVAIDGDTRKMGRRWMEAKLNAEPKATQGLTKCPKHLGPVARKVWRFWEEELRVMGISRRPDSQMLEGLCVAYETALWAYEQIQKHGRLLVKREKVKTVSRDPATGIVTRSEEMVAVGVTKNPAVVIGNEAWAQVKAFCAEFGLSPVSRTRIAAAINTSGVVDAYEEAIG